jgi:hypothetical protein
MHINSSGEGVLRLWSNTALTLATWSDSRDRIG